MRSHAGGPSKPPSKATTSNEAAFDGMKAGFLDGAAGSSSGGGLFDGPHRYV